MSKRRLLVQVIGLSFPFSTILKKLKRIIPIVTIIPIQILLIPNFNYLSLTLEKKIPTMTTERRLHDLTITTAGNEAYITALL